MDTFSEYDDLFVSGQAGDWGEVAEPHPTDPNRSVFVDKAYTTDADVSFAQDLADIMDVTMDEDIAIIESVQRGMHSHAFEHGMLLLDEAQSEKSEHTIFHFQQYLRAKLFSL